MSSNFQGETPVDHIDTSAEFHLSTPLAVGVTGQKSQKGDLKLGFQVQTQAGSLIYSFLHFFPFSFLTLPFPPFLIPLCYSPTSSLFINYLAAVFPDMQLVYRLFVHYLSTKEYLQTGNKKKLKNHGTSLHRMETGLLFGLESRTSGLNEVKILGETPVDINTLAVSHLVTPIIVSLTGKKSFKNIFRTRFCRI